MSSDPISWMVSFSLGQIADRLLHPSTDRKLAKKLLRTVRDWAKNSHPPVHAGALDTIFSGDFDESDPDRFAARRRLTETILRKRVPSTQKICDALLERWEEIRSANDAEDLDQFFRLSRDDASNQFADLAAQTRIVLQEDQSTFQVTTVDLLEGLGTQADIHDRLGQISGQKQQDTLDLILSGVSQLRAFATHERETGNNDIIAEDVQNARELVRTRQYLTALPLLQNIEARRWDSLSSVDRYYVLASLGIIYDVQEKFDQAAESFIRAKQYHPTHERARCFEAIAYVINRDPEKARMLAEEILRDFPDSAMAASVLVRVAPPSMEAVDVASTIPACVRCDAEVASCLSYRAMACGDFVAAEEYARVAYKDSPDSPRVLEQCGTAILQNAADELHMAYARAPNSAQRARIQEAVDLLTRSIATEKDYSPPASLAMSYNNRSFAHGLLGNERDAERDAQDAYSKGPSVPEVVVRYAMLLQKNDQIEKGIVCLIETYERAPSDKVGGVLAYLLCCRGAKEDKLRALAILEERWPRIEDANEYTRTEMLWTLVLLYAEFDRREEAFDLVKKSVPTAISHSVAQVLSSRVYSIHGANDCARAAILDAFENRSTINDSVTRYRLAEELERCGLFDEACTVWQEQFHPHVRDEVVVRLLNCAKRIQDDKTILKVCEELRLHGIWDARYVELESQTLFKYGDYEEAITLLEKATESIDDADSVARLQLRLSVLGVHLDRADLIVTEPSRLPTVDKIVATEILAMVRLLARGSQPNLAVDFAYRFLRSNFDEPIAHRALMVLQLEPFGIKPELEESLTVRAGFAFFFRRGNNDTVSFFIIEDGDDPRFERNELAPNHSIAKSATGKRVGDTFVTNPGGLIENEATIREIMPKYRARLWDSAQHFTERFPGDPNFQVFSTRKPDGEEFDLGPMRELLDRSAKAQSQLDSQYQELVLPMNVYVEFFGRTVFEWTSSLAKKNIKIRCCSGTNEELVAASQTLDDSKQFIIDPTALGTIFVLDKMELLDRVGAFAVTASTMASIRNARVTETRTAMLKKLDQLIEIIQSKGHVESGRPMVDEPLGARQDLIKIVGRECAESLIVARTLAQTLWTDDFVVGTIARNDHGVRRVWTQMVAQWMGRTGKLDADYAIDVSLGLIERGYFFSVLFPEAIVRAAISARWDFDCQPLRAVLEEMGNPSIEPNGLVNLLGKTIYLVWRRSPLEQAAETLIFRMLNSVSEHPRGVAIIAIIESSLDSLFGVDVISCARTKQVFAIWRQTGRRIVPG